MPIDCWHPWSPIPRVWSYNARCSATDISTPGKHHHQSCATLGARSVICPTGTKVGGHWCLTRQRNYSKNFYKSHKIWFGVELVPLFSPCRNKHQELGLVRSHNLEKMARGSPQTRTLPKPTSNSIHGWSRATKMTANRSSLTPSNGGGLKPTNTYGVCHLGEHVQKVWENIKEVDLPTLQGWPRALASNHFSQESSSGSVKDTGRCREVDGTIRILIYL